MAGVVAMASVIEDFETRPCKKSRKDGDSPLVKTITNYFSPIPKATDKPFSPPRTNNIMDYFNRKPPSSKEGTPEQTKENCQNQPQSTEKHTTEEGAVRDPGKPSRGRRKPSKAARRLQRIETVEENKAAGEPVRGVIPAQSTCCMLGSDTGSLLAQLCHEDLMADRDDPKTEDATLAKNNEIREGNLKCGKSTTAKPEPNCHDLPPLAPKDKVKRARTLPGKCRKKKSKEEKMPAPETRDPEQSLCDASMEVNVDEDSQLNTSMITVSFEEFLQSQNQENSTELECKGDVASWAEMETGQLCENTETIQQEISPRTLTVQAEVHAVSTKPVKAVKKMASIFTKRKGAEGTLSPHSQMELSPTTTAPKRKSNVVLLEADLELAVEESESSSKCSQAERKQFMAAFKRPGLDAANPKPGKSQVKQTVSQVKQTVGRGGTQEEDLKTEASEVPTVAPETAEDENKAKTKGTRTGKKRASRAREEVTPSPATAGTTQETPAVPGGGAKPTSVAAEVEGSTPVRATRQSAETAGVSEDGSLQTSTPKSRHKSKHGVFKADLVCPADKKGSPIRMKFTRIQRNALERGTHLEIPSPLATSRAHKKKARAKRLLEKAKEMRQSKTRKVGIAEEKAALRRSSRSQTAISKCFVEDEDSVICLDDEPEKPPSRRKQHIRNLNDVLGKRTAIDKTKTQASKVAPLFQDKKAQRASPTVSISDEGSRDGTDRPEDDEVSRARREFLKSGLPESFRKQVAKTTATREACSSSSHSSLQPVVHVLQTPQDCPLWSLPWPASSFICSLKDSWGLPSKPLPPAGGSFHCKTEPASRAFPERGSGCRQELSDHVRQLLLEEVSAANPTFPSQRFLTRFLKRRADLQQSTALAPIIVAQASSAKRKRADEDETPGAVAKKQRSVRPEEKDRAEGVSTPEPARRGGRASRRCKPQKEEEPKESPPIVLEDSTLAGSLAKEDMVKEEVLWTEKYQPQHSSDIIGNIASVRRLHSWLKEWKLRADREERKKQKETSRPGEGSNDSDWDCGTEDSQDQEDMLCNTLLITGPTGVGKTAAVYACAQELGFKVFEVNSSSQRSGRLILSQLKEATQSHQVDVQGVNAHKPAYFNSYGSSAAARPGSSPRKLNSPRRVVSSPRKQPQSPRGAKRGGLAPTSLANFFKVGRPANKGSVVPNKPQPTAAAPKKATKTKEVGSKLQAAGLKAPPASSGEEQVKKTATSLILFEEVDVIFDDDSGFLAAIKTFMTTTKRPVILTTSDPNFSTMFDGNFEEICFKTPSLLNVSSYLRLLCLAEDVRTDPLDVGALLSLNSCDIRQSLLQLQFWTCSTGGRSRAKQMEQSHSIEAEVKAAVSSGAGGQPDLPVCDTGCAESMLGLLNIQPQGSIQELLRRSTQDAAYCELVTDSRRRGVDLLYSNLQTLLPLPVTQLPSTTLRIQPSASRTEELPASPARPWPHGPAPPRGTAPPPAESADMSDDASPVKVSQRMRKKGRKRRQALAVQDPLQSDSDSEDGFISLCKPRVSAQAEEEVLLPPPRVKREPLTHHQRALSAPVSHCLGAIADFLDDMSCMDSSPWLSSSPPGGNGGGTGATPGTWLHAQVKDGMVDEPRLECSGAGRADGECAVEIQAAAEALSFQRCVAGVVKAQEEARALGSELGEEPVLELSLPVPSHQREFSLSHHPPCQPKLLQRCKEVMTNLLSRGVFGTLGSRREMSLEYLPTLRTICRSERLKEQGKVKRRFLHYLDAIHLGIPRDTLQHLAEDFP